MNKIVIPQAAIDQYNEKYADKLAKYKVERASNIPFYLDEDAIYEQYLQNVKASECPRKE